MSHPYAIRVEHLSKRYRMGERLGYRMLRDVVHEHVVSAWQALAGKSHQSPGVLWALDDVTLEVPAGQSTGLIGSNGAGKTTLLKIISRITAPTSGHVRIRGRVGSLLEVDTGFHPELTGRENVYLNGAILGMRRGEIDRKFDEIVAFSETGQFLDTPMKFYSAGMQMRLAFSVAVHLEPEIMLVDEILAVGDLAFQSKSLTKMLELVRGGSTILFVSHNLSAIRSLCQAAVYLDGGQLKYSGSVEDTIACYVRSGRGQIAAQLHSEPDPDKPIQFTDVFVVDSSGQVTSRLPVDRPFSIQIRLAVHVPLVDARLGLSIDDDEQDALLTSYDSDSGRGPLLRLDPGIYTYRVEVPAPLLIRGQYTLSVGVFRETPAEYKPVVRIEHVCPFEVFDSRHQSGSFIKWNGRVAPALQWVCLEAHKSGATA